MKGKYENKTITARSKQHDVGYDKRAALNEALESFWERVHQAAAGGYDASEGILYADKVKGPIYGVIQYAKSA